MKKKGEYRDRIDRLAAEIQENLFDIEKSHRSTGEKIQRLQEEAAELIGIGSESGSSYVQERALRLQTILGRLDGQYNLLQAEFGILHRQIDKIKDTVLSDYFSPSLNRRIDKLVESRFAPEGTTVARPSRKNRFIIYRLGEMHFGVYGRLIKHLKNISAGSAKKIKIQEGQIGFFPEKEDSAFFREEDTEIRDLLVVKRPGMDSKYMGLWCEELVRLEERDPSDIEARIQPLNVPHRYVAGKMFMGGVAIYWLKNTARPLHAD